MSGSNLLPRLTTALALLAGLWAGLSASGCNLQPERCAICYMVIPDDTRAVVSVDGQRTVTCDPRCPLTFQEQTGRTVLLLQVTDFASAAALDPAKATFVTGSNTAPDAHTHAVRMSQNETAYLHWHRCLPSVLAFASREAAADFQRQQGGAIVSAGDLGFGQNH